jgi:hypothetical protein
MKQAFLSISRAVLLLTLLASCFLVQAQIKGDTEKDKKLFSQLAQKDSILFDAAFNTCNIKALESVLAPGFEFYHDNGLQNPTTKETHSVFVEGIQKNFCGSQGMKMRREIVKNTLQVFSPDELHAMQTGAQRFFILLPDKKEQLVEESKFSRTWQKTGNDWKLATEIDYLVNTHPAGDNATAAAGQRYQPADYVPEPRALYDTIVQMDSIYFDTYNTCNLEKMASMTSENLEFYHDRGGLTNSKTDYIASIKKNICGKVTRELMPNSIEVYPIKDFGAVEIGYHRFHNNQEPGGTISRASKFIVIWHRTTNGWEIMKVVSLH